MGGLITSLITTSSAMQAFEKSLSVVQNNVTNVNTPGYARQRLPLTPVYFSTLKELSGGVRAGNLLSSRDAYLEQAVWRQNSQASRQAQLQQGLSQVEASFPIGANAEIPASLAGFFNAVSSWSVSPNDPVARQVVLDRADASARAFRSTAEELGRRQASAGKSIQDTVETVNALAGRLRELNVELRSDRRNLEDPSLDARVHATLEELSQYVDFGVLRQSDGSFTVLLGSQSPLVQGDRQTMLSVAFEDGRAQIVDERGVDVTGRFTEGGLKGWLEIYNDKIPSYMADLNRLAETFASRVNEVLAGGLDANHSPPQENLFRYDPNTGSAATLSVAPLQPSDLAGAATGAPGGNGNVLALEALRSTAEIDGVSFANFYGRLSGRVGRDVANARNSAEFKAELATRARELRDEASGISLDEEAARLVEMQRAYQANARMFQVLNDLTDTLMGMIR